LTSPLRRAFSFSIAAKQALLGGGQRFGDAQQHHGVALAEQLAARQPAAATAADRGGDEWLNHKKIQHTDAPLPVPPQPAEIEVVSAYFDRTMKGKL